MGVLFIEVVGIEVLPVSGLEYRINKRDRVRVIKRKASLLMPFIYYS